MFGSVKCTPRCGGARPHFLRFCPGISMPGSSNAVSMQVSRAHVTRRSREQSS